MMKLDRHEADSAFTYLGDPPSSLLRSADVLYRPPLIFLPVWVLSPENLGTQRLLERREDRRPRPQREVDHRAGVSIVERSNPRLDGLHLLTLRGHPDPRPYRARPEGTITRYSLFGTSRPYSG